MTDLQLMLTLAREAAAIGGQMLQVGNAGEIYAKDDRDFVTDLDIAIQESIREHLTSQTPDIGFIGEEDRSSHTASSSISPNIHWILDPIDGTSNFSHGLPMCAVSLALVIDGVPCAGAINAPLLGLEYYAYMGGGAFCNDHLIQTSQTSELRNAIVSIGDYAVGAHAYSKNRHRIAVTDALAAQVERVRMFGSAALDLAWVAEGRIDGCVLLSNKPWDTAAGVVIARESGSVVVDSDGSDHSLTAAHTIAANSAIAKSLLELITSATPPPRDEARCSWL